MIRVFAAMLLTVGLAACNDRGGDAPPIAFPPPPPMGCGGCEPPPVCGAPESFCSCGCVPGEIFGTMVCTGEGCLAPLDATVRIDASSLDGAVCAGRDYCACSGVCQPVVDLAQGCLCTFDDPFNCTGEMGSCVCGGAEYAGCVPVGRCPSQLRCGSCGTVLRDGCPICDPTCGDGGLPDASTPDANTADADTPDAS